MVGIHKRKILREKVRKHAIDQEKKNRFKEKRRKTLSLLLYSSAHSAFTFMNSFNGSGPGPEYYKSVRRIYTGWASGDEVVGKGLELFGNQLINFTLLNLLMGKRENQQNA